MRLLNRSAGRLSRHRRGPLAGLVVLLLGLLLTGGLYTAFSPAQAGQADASEEQVAQGRDLFLVSCAFCHGQNGEGMRTTNSKGGDNQLGPSLVGVGAAAVDFQVGTGRMPMVQPGAQVPQQAADLHRRGDRRAGGVRRLARAPARRSPTRATTASRACPTRSARRRSPAAARSS